MNNGTHPTVPRGSPDSAFRPSPLDPYVRALLTWIIAHDRKLSARTLAQQAAIQLEWPLPFAEAIVTAARSRRLIALAHSSGRRHPVTVSRHGRDWLERTSLTSAAAS